MDNLSCLFDVPPVTMWISLNSGLLFAQKRQMKTHETLVALIADVVVREQEEMS